MLRPLDFWLVRRAAAVAHLHARQPVVWWASAYCMLYLLVNFVPKLPALVQRVQPAPAAFAELLLIGAYLANMLPFTQIRRVMFIYHYLPALGFALLAVGLLLDRSGATRIGSERPCSCWRQRPSSGSRRSATGCRSRGRSSTPGCGSRRAVAPGAPNAPLPEPLREELQFVGRAGLSAAARQCPNGLPVANHRPMPSR